MAKKDKFEIKSMPELVFRAIWLAFACLMFFVGLLMFLEQKANGTFFAWFVWGLFCLPAVIIPVVKHVIGFTKSGVRDGSRQHNITISNSGVTSSTNAFMGGLISLVMSGAAAIFAGPIVLGWYMLMTVFGILIFLLERRKNKKARQTAVKEEEKNGGR